MGTAYGPQTVSVKHDTVPAVVADTDTAVATLTFNAAPPVAQQVVFVAQLTVETQASTSGIQLEVYKGDVATGEAIGQSNVTFDQTTTPGITVPIVALDPAFEGEQSQLYTLAVLISDAGGASTVTSVVFSGSAY